MGQHADYGRKLISGVAEGCFTDDREATRVEYGGDTSAFIDGVIKSECAVEIESRVDKQVRGALVDLLSHPYPKKLLILIPAHMNNPEKTKKQCEGILNKFKRPTDQVVVALLKGTGDGPMPKEDEGLLRVALSNLGVL
jgi:hypothetical protein